MKRIFEVTLSLLSPLHIGSGKELLRDYDYVTYGGKTWVINAETMLEHFQRADGSFDERLIGRPAAELLRPEDYRANANYFRYVLPGQPRSTEKGAVLREQYKDVFHRPYLPGASLKGALRTVLAWHGFQEQKQTFQVSAIQSGRSWAGQRMERQIFGQDPNHDLLRALQVADSQPQSHSALRIVNAQVVTGDEKLGSPIEVEALWTDTELKTTLTLDTFLRSPSAEKELHFEERWQWLEQLPVIAQRWASEQLRREQAWFRQRKYDGVSQLYGQMLALLERNRLAPQQFFLQIGWGGGWNSKTIGYPLQSNKTEWERLLNDKRLSPARFRRNSGDPFPKSRRVMVLNRQVAAPLGWCLVEMKERK